MSAGAVADLLRRARRPRSLPLDVGRIRPRRRVDLTGEPTPGGRLTSTPPTPGDNLKLSLNQAVQEAGESALAQRGLAGAFVSMNIKTGEILGMGSYPTFDPSVWTPPVSEREYHEITSEETGDPLAVGQGYLQTDPLEMAIAYAALGNGGTIVTPHLGKEVEDAAGRVLQEIDPGPRRHVQINPEYQRLIMEELHDVTSGPGGTATSVFENFPIPIAGKTGTAERRPHPNQAWFISLSPYPNRTWSRW